MTGECVISSQDWYRVRRGEDQIAWGGRWEASGLPRVVFSERARAEFAFLEPAQQAALVSALGDMTTAADDAKGEPVAHGQSRRVLHVASLRVVFRLDEGRAWISTIRGGPVLDPENEGPPPEGDIDWAPA